MRIQSEIGLREQAAFMRMHWPHFKTKVAGAKLKSTGPLCPTEISDVYVIEILLEGAGVPEVRVLRPILGPRPGSEMIPHMYGQDRLCLYTPGWGEWTASKPIATTILPWASLWLYFYETWHATGAWLGGGHEPVNSNCITEEANDRFERPRHPR